MLRLLCGVALVLTTLFATATMALSREWEAGEMDEGWQVIFTTSSINELGGNIMNLDGTGVQQLMLDGMQMAYPSCSSSGDYLTFALAHSLYVASADGTDQHHLDYDATNFTPLSISDNGKFVVVSTTISNVILDMESSIDSVMSDPMDANGFWYRLSPDGSRIAFQLGSYRSYDLYVENTNGTALTKLAVQAIHPAWSPDGSLMAYTALWNGDYNIFLMDIYRGLSLQLTRQGNGFANLLVPAWSPDSRHITYSRVPNTNNYGGDIYVMDADGKEQRSLTNPATTVLASCLLAGRPGVLVAGS